MSFTIKIESETIEDIQEGIDWYNKQKSGPGENFFSEVKTAINQLKIHPFFQVRYDNVRCLPLKNYPYMLHFTVHEDQNEVNYQSSV